MAPLLPLTLLTRASFAPLLKEKCSLSFLVNLLLSTIPLSRSVLSLASVRAMGKPSCVDSFVPVWAIRRGRMKVGWRAAPGPCVCLQTPHCFPTPPPAPFLHSSLLLLLLSQGRQLNKEVWVRHPFFSLGLSLIKSVALGRFFLFVSVWRAEDTGTQNTSMSFLQLPLQTSTSSSAFFLFFLSKGPVAQMTKTYFVSYLEWYLAKKFSFSAQ